MRRRVCEGERGPLGVRQVSMFCKDVVHSSCSCVSVFLAGQSRTLLHVHRALSFPSDIAERRAWLAVTEATC
jgi:hypothetical protein